MNKHEFVAELGARLRGLPEREAEERIAFYLEAIDDRIEEGLSEEEAVLAAGDVDQIALQIMEDIPLGAIVKRRIRQTRRLAPWEITMLVLGFPLWFSLLVALFSVAVSLFATLWSLLVSAWAVAISLIGAGVGGFFGGCVLLCVGELVGGGVLLSAALVALGLSVLAVIGAVAASKGTVRFSARIPRWIKRCFVRRGDSV